MFARRPEIMGPVLFSIAAIFSCNGLRANCTSLFTMAISVSAHLLCKHRTILDVLCDQCCLESIAGIRLHRSSCCPYSDNITIEYRLRDAPNQRRTRLASEQANEVRLCSGAGRHGRRSRHSGTFPHATFRNAGSEQTRRSQCSSILVSVFPQAQRARVFH